MKKKMVKKMLGFIVVAADSGANGLWIMDLETTDYTDYTDYTDFNHECTRMHTNFLQSTEYTEETNASQTSADSR